MIAEERLRVSVRFSPSGISDLTSLQELVSKALPQRQEIFQNKLTSVNVVTQHLKYFAFFMFVLLEENNSTRDYFNEQFAT